MIKKTNNKEIKCQFSLSQVGWGDQGNQIEFTVALAPAINFLGVAQHEPGGSRGTSFSVSFSALHNSIQGPMGGSLALLLDGHKVEVDLSLALAHFGIINLSHKHNGALDFQTDLACTCLSSNINRYKDMSNMMHYSQHSSWKCL